MASPSASTGRLTGKEFTSRHGQYMTRKAQLSILRYGQAFFKTCTIEAFEPQHLEKWLSEERARKKQRFLTDVRDYYEQTIRDSSQGKVGIEDAFTEEWHEVVQKAIESNAERITSIAIDKIRKGNPIFEPPEEMDIAFPSPRLVDFRPSVQPLIDTKFFLPPENGNEDIKNLVRNWLSKEVLLPGSDNIISDLRTSLAGNFYADYFPYLTKAAREQYKEDPVEFFKTCTIHEIAPKLREEWLKYMRLEMSRSAVLEFRIALGERDQSRPEDPRFITVSEKIVLEKVDKVMHSLLNGSPIFKNFLFPYVHKSNHALGFTVAQDAILFVPELTTQPEQLLKFFIYVADRSGKPFGTFSENDCALYLDDYCQIHRLRNHYKEKKAAPVPVPSKKKKKKKKSRAIQQQNLQPPLELEPHAQERLAFLNNFKSSEELPEHPRVSHAEMRKYRGSIRRQQVLQDQHTDLQDTTALLAADFSEEFCFTYKYQNAKGEEQFATGLLVKFKGQLMVLEIGFHEGEIYHRRLNPCWNQQIAPEEEDDLMIYDLKNFLPAIPAWSLPEAVDEKEDGNSFLPLQPLMEEEERQATPFHMIPGNKNLFLNTQKGEIEILHLRDLPTRAKSAAA